MKTSFALAMLATAASAVSMKKYAPQPAYHGPVYNEPQYGCYEPEYAPSYNKPGHVDYSTSFKGVGPLMPKGTNYFKPDYISRGELEEDSYEGHVPQYRSVKWGNGPYESWDQIDPLDQPAAYEKPSYVQSLISPSIVVNNWDNSEHYQKYGGIGGVKRRSEGVDYNQRVFKHTPSDGYRRDTKYEEYNHTECSATDNYRPPKPYQLYPKYQNEKKVRTPGTAGVVQVGVQAPLEYPEYETRSYEYEKMVPQKYTVSKTEVYNPKTPHYEGPHYDFYEYEVPEHDTILPTYYEPGCMRDDYTWGYIDRPDYVEDETDWCFEPTYYQEPCVSPKYPTTVERTYTPHPIREVEFSGPKIQASSSKASLYPKYEHVPYEAAKFRPAEYKEPGYRTDFKAYNTKDYAKSYKAPRPSYYENNYASPSYDCGSCYYTQ